MTNNEVVTELKSLSGKMTQEKMAHGIGVSVSTGNRWLNDVWEPHRYLIPQIQRFIDEQK